MTVYNPGDVLLVPYPFGERAGGKKRPVLVISSLAHNEATGEVVVAQLTGRINAPPRPGDYRIENWREASLPGPALVRGRLATLESSLVLRRLGALTAVDLSRARAALTDILPISSKKALS